MSRRIVFNWLPEDTVAVSTLQTFAAPDTQVGLAIDGTASNYLYTGSMIRVATFPGLQRVVTLTSTNNLSAVNFTIKGTLNGKVVSETRVGPNNNTVSTTQLFNTITNITFDAAVTAVSAGTGFTGATNPFQFDYHSKNGILGIQVGVTNGTGAITYSTEITLDDLNEEPNPFYLSPIAAMTAAITSQVANLNQPMTYARVKITASTGTAKLAATFIQQSLTD